ncbi:sulfur oxidation c-type cytochrome SoxX [Hyphomicrobium sp.]|uniref:sulfur oxidation c-type cytochrome SoxX n=1 Tax=Hyphomicrobium sp. TaxID=82 RepID=UPI002E33660E|nr:sulfur oxidation c-type cytochrome SoxX [Hyphomicrobium sp.]HEX2841267.1 sulfur oxidation c-type cytochrome SoxX [Hyphomicrobium sp.]
MSLQSNANRPARYAAIIVALVAATSALAESATPKGPAEGTAGVERYVREMWASSDAKWKDRLKQDETQVLCSRFRNNPPEPLAQSIQTREAATIVFPKDNQVLGRWQEGEKLAQNGRGGQFSDAPDTVNGGNCYACHQMAKSELSFGTLGPSLSEYGKIRNFSAEAARDTFAKIYNSQATLACSSMPRFGAHGFLTEQQIKDVVAYLFDPDSPINK